MSDVIVVGFDGSDDVNESIMNGKIDAGALQPVAEMAIQAAIQADLYIRTGETGKDEKQSIDMVLLTPENACQYKSFAPTGSTESCAPAATEEPAAAAGGGLICVIVPGVENPFFGSMQEIAAANRPARRSARSAIPRAHSASAPAGYVEPVRGIHPARGPIVADRQRLTQAVMNLVQNAVAHSEVGDEIEVKASAALLQTVGGFTTMFFTGVFCRGGPPWPPH